LFERKQQKSLAALCLLKIFSKISRKDLKKSARVIALGSAEAMIIKESIEQLNLNFE
jgi:hypothetical protein